MFLLFVETVPLFGLSPFLKNPDELVPYAIECAEFWIPSYDETAGGFFTNVGLTGEPEGSRDKALLTQSRNAYAMAKAFQLTGNEAYLGYADGALRFLYEHGWDSENMGWYGMVDQQGSVIRPSAWFNNSKWSFWQHYMLLGPAVMVEATRDPLHVEWLARGNAINDELLWDATPGREGYWNRAGTAWNFPNGKGFTPTVDAMTTNTLQNYLLNREPERRDRLVAVADNMIDHLVASMELDGVNAGFVEDFSSNWSPVYDGSTSASIGHFIKTAWCLARAYLIEPDERYKAGAIKILDQVMDPSTGIWDEVAGVMADSVKIGQGYASGHASWWTVEQGFTGGLINWYLTRDPDYLRLAEASLTFFMDHYYDHENSEVFKEVRPDGTVADDLKGDMFKGGYHSVELFYLGYVYGNLYYKNRPVTLYYRFKPQPEARAIHLWPVAIEDERLVIAGVRQAGRAFPSFDPGSRMLTLGAGEGGVFEVTFRSRYPFNITPDFRSGWISDWMGTVYMVRDDHPWVYHPELGWLASVPGGTGAGYWFYAPESGWFWTEATLFPWVYRPDSGWIPLETDNT
jgi:mannose/cellobiose epimerase-like protein (N-acyl-D-glucosamine 2-epimerase family)